MLMNICTTACCMALLLALQMTWEKLSCRWTCFEVTIASLGSMNVLIMAPLYKQYHASKGFAREKSAVTWLLICT